MRILELLFSLTGIRDRLRCPCCAAVGTYKPHASCLDGRGNRRPWRWLCKFCGYYRGPEGTGFLCYPSKSQKGWVFFTDNHPDEDKRTPRDILRDRDVWPWRG